MSPVLQPSAWELLADDQMSDQVDQRAIPIGLKAITSNTSTSPRCLLLSCGPVCTSMTPNRSIDPGLSEIVA